MIYREEIYKFFKDNVLEMKTAYKRNHTRALRKAKFLLPSSQKITSNT